MRPHAALGVLRLILAAGVARSATRFEQQPLIMQGPLASRPPPKQAALLEALPPADPLCQPPHRTAPAHLQCKLKTLTARQAILRACRPVLQSPPRA